MTIEERDREIKLMRKSGMTYGQIGKKFGITVERVRQIIHNISSPYCEKHQRSHERSECELCVIEDF